MSQIDDIRTWMAAQSAPVTSTEVAEALELEPKPTRDLLYQSAKNRNGIERLDDGTYSLVPGWVPRKMGRAPTAKPARKAPKRKAAAKPACKPHRKATEPCRAKLYDPSSSCTLVPIERIALRTLADAVLAGDTPIDAATRSALRAVAAALQ